jgi:hypothetical protein
MRSSWTIFLVVQTGLARRRVRRLRLRDRHRGLQLVELLREVAPRLAELVESEAVLAEQGDDLSEDARALGLDALDGLLRLPVERFRQRLLEVGLHPLRPPPQDLVHPPLNMAVLAGVA